MCILDKARLTVCGHRYCEKCITEWVNRQHKCPCCNHPLTVDQLIKDHQFDSMLSMFFFASFHVIFTNKQIFLVKGEVLEVVYLLQCVKFRRKKTRRKVDTIAMNCILVITEVVFMPLN